MSSKKAIVILTVIGFLIILAYLNFALKLFPLSGRLALILAFAIGPVAVFGVFSIYNELSQTDKTVSLKIGVIFLIIAFAFLNLMLVVQQSIFIPMKDYIAQETDTVRQDSLRLVLRGLNLVQLGIDVSFDIFYCLGLILMALAMYGHPGYGRIIGVFGILSGMLLLVFNMSTFPKPPADAGLIDLGPVTGVWWLAVITKMVVNSKKKARPVIAT